MWRHHPKKPVFYRFLTIFFFQKHRIYRWSEPAATSAPVQDEALQAVLRMNKKHILFPCPGIFQPPSLPQNFLLVPTPPPPTYLPTYLSHLISRSFHLESSGELPSLSNTETWHKAWGRWRAQHWRNVERRKQEERFIPNVKAREER